MSSEGDRQVVPSTGLLESLEKVSVSGKHGYETTLWAAVVDGKRLSITTEARRTPTGSGYDCKLSYDDPADDPDPGDWSAHYSLIEERELAPRLVAEFIADKLGLVPILISRPELSTLESSAAEVSTPVAEQHDISA